MAVTSTSAVLAAVLILPSTPSMHNKRACRASPCTLAQGLGVKVPLAMIDGDAQPHSTEPRK